MLVAFSTQDQAKLQVVAGSMRDAFGVQDRVRYSGIIEMLGLPTRPKPKNSAHIDPSEASSTPSQNEHDRQRAYGARFKEDRKFSLASASLRQALQEMPEIAEASKHIIFEDTKDGLNNEIVDQNGRSMFPEGSKQPYEHTRILIEKMAPALKAMPYRVSPGTRHRPGSRPSRGTAHGNFPRIAPMRSAKSWPPRGCLVAMSTWWPERLTPSRCFPTTRIFRQIAASRSL